MLSALCKVSIKTCWDCPLNSSLRAGRVLLEIEQSERFRKIPSILPARGRIDLFYPALKNFYSAEIAITGDFQGRGLWAFASQSLAKPEKKSNQLFEKRKLSKDAHPMKQHRILDVRGLADLDDGRIDLPKTPRKAGDGTDAMEKLRSLEERGLVERVDLEGTGGDPAEVVKNVLSCLRGEPKIS